MSKKKSNQFIKSPLRYPGGKQKAVDFLSLFFPQEIDAFVEPMVGGGSVMLYIRQQYPKAELWINDLNPEVYIFWKSVRDDLDNLIKGVEAWYSVKKNFLTKEKKFFEFLKNICPETLGFTNRAARWYVLNRVTFSGTLESGGFSKDAFHKRFTISSIERLAKLKGLLEGTVITNIDYESCLSTKAKQGGFVFLDPPYLSAEKSKLYGINGSLHTGFPHARLKEVVHGLTNPVMITYDDSEAVRNLYPEEKYEKIAWELGYGMTNGKSGKELIIRNYKS